MPLISIKILLQTWNTAQAASLIEPASLLAVLATNASNNLVQDSVFAMNNGGMTIRDASHRNVIQDSEFYDTIFAWPWDAVKETGLLERGGVYAAGSPSARGNVIRRNVFHDYFDAFDVCPGEPDPGEPVHPTNERVTR
jgi:hypothetical protein